jgi:hypothetical protein
LSRSDPGDGWGGIPQYPTPGEYVRDGGHWRACLGCVLPDCHPSWPECRNELAHRQAVAWRGSEKSAVERADNEATA